MSIVYFAFLYRHCLVSTEGEYYTLVNGENAIYICVISCHLSLMACIYTCSDVAICSLLIPVCFCKTSVSFQGLPRDIPVILDSSCVVPIEWYFIWPFSETFQKVDCPLRNKLVVLIVWYCDTAQYTRGFLVKINNLCKYFFFVAAIWLYKARALLLGYCIKF